MREMFWFIRIIGYLNNVIIYAIPSNGNDVTWRLTFDAITICTQLCREQLINCMPKFGLFEFVNCYIDGFMQERRNCIANAWKLCLSCTNPAILSTLKYVKIRQGSTAIIWWQFWEKICGYISIKRFNSSPPGRNGRHFANVIFRYIFVNEKFCFFYQNFADVCS